MAATLPPEPKSFRTPQEVAEYMQRVLDRGEDGLSWLRPRITPDPQRDAEWGGTNFVIRAGDDEHGGEKSVGVRLREEHLARPGKALIEFHSAYGSLIGELGKTFREIVFSREPDEVPQHTAEDE
jgi:hypothetical protein